MKLGKGGVAALGATAAVLVFSAGHYMGGNSASGDYQVQLQRPAQTQAVSPPAPSERPLVDVNTADSDTLQTLPGIGPQRAADIIAYREANGPFRYAEEITKVPGIGEGILAELVELITAGEVTE